MPKIQRAVISVFDKTGLIPFAQALVAAGIEIISTGGTAKALREHGIVVSDLSAYTEFPEMMDGRVKTLHPRIHGGLLYLRGNKTHEAAARKHDIKPIDLVVVNLYPFEQTVSRPDVTLAEAVENIDIGGPSMLRSAAKNHESVTVVIDPSDYAEVADQIIANGMTTLELRQRLATRAFARTASYDGQIAAYLGKTFNVKTKDSEPRASATAGKADQWPEEFQRAYPFAQALRYGENPHQRAALYGSFKDFFQQLAGKELSYNNILDMTAAADLALEFLDDSPTVAIVKHTNPCGVGQGATLREAWDKAFETDKQAPFGGIIACNRPLDLPCAEAIYEIFSEVIVAPGFAPEALELLGKKKSLRLIKTLKGPSASNNLQFRSVGADSLLVQDCDAKKVTAADLKIVGARKPSDAELRAMLFGWRIVKHVKSNAIVFTGQDRTLGIGAGQMSRVDSSRLAVWKAAQAGLSLKGSVVCSDAFFPFADGLIAASEAGATAAIEPGGSVRDAEVIAAADQRGMALAFTGIRHFRH
jgi:phosphoribosylaminoimidazolecarboxamide formyltransferase/IMP cyclohydrolase